MTKLLLMGMIALPFVGCSESVALKVDVTDEEGYPVTNAVLKIQALKKLFVGAGGKPSDFRSVEAHANSNGVVSVSFDAVTCDSTYWLSAEGYYNPPYHDIHYKLKKDHLFYVELAEHEKEESVVMRKKKNPIPMFGYGAGVEVKFPAGERNGDYGYDMTAGDWVAPLGSGRVADFYVKRDFCENPRRTKSAVHFKGKGNGAYKIKAFTGSEFRSCYEANTNAAFKDEFRYEFSLNKERAGHSDMCDCDYDECLILRTRCNFDERGTLVSCHYSKIYGKIEICDRFKFKAYAFNPTPNDPNLEFDVKRNLLKKDTAPYLP